MAMFEQEQKPKMSLSEIIQGLALETGKGALLGLEKPVAGVGGVIGQVAGNIATKKPLFEKINEGYKYGVDLAKEREAQIEKQHPAAAALVNIASGIPAAGAIVGKGAIAGSMKLGQQLLQGTKMGAKIGGIYGVGAGVGEALAEPGKAKAIDVAASTGLGIAGGGIMGGLAPLGIKAIGGGVSFAKRAVTGKGIEKLVKQLPKNVITDAIKANVSLLKQGDPRAATLAADISRSHTGAKNILLPEALTELSEQPKKVKDVIRILSKSGKYETLDELAAKNNEVVKPLYQKAEAYGDLAQEVDSADKINALQDIKRITETPFVKSYLQEAKNSPLAIDSKFTMGVEELPDTHIRIIDLAKRKMDSEIGGLYKAGKDAEATALKNIKNKMLDAADKLNPDYKAARNASADIIKVRSILEDDAEDILKSKSTEAFNRIYGDLTDTEKEAVKLGLKEKIINNLQNEKSLDKNVALKIFGDNPDYKMRQHLKTLLGDDYPAFETEINKLVRSGQAASTVLSSQGTGATYGRADELAGYTPEGEIKVATTPKRLLKSIIQNMANKTRRADYPDIAALMIHPEYLAQQFAKLNTREQSILSRVLQSIQRPVAGSLAERQAIISTGEIQK